jgi:hypothetical protein
VIAKRFGGLQYKYHRVAGYTILTLVLVNVILATKTFYGGSILKIKTWVTVLGSILVVLGMFSRPIYSAVLIVPARRRPKNQEAENPSVARLSMAET